MGCEITQFMVSPRWGWCGEHTTQTRAREAAFERITATTEHAAQRERSRGYGLEL